MRKALKESWKVGVVEDDPEFLKQIQDILLEQPGVDAVYTWASAEEFQGFSELEQLDILFLDIQLPGASGVMLAEQVRDAVADLPIIMLTTVSDEATVFECLKVGASGYLLKLQMERLPGFLTDIMAGGTAISPEIAIKVMGYFRKVGGMREDFQLTPTELKILKMVSLGESRQDIAAAMAISINTVKSHMRNVYKKLNVNNRASLADVAHRNGLI